VRLCVYVIAGKKPAKDMSARSTGEKNKESAIITVSGWLRATLIKANRTTEDTEGTRKESPFPCGFRIFRGFNPWTVKPLI
jgi:hypothetical protein